MTRSTKVFATLVGIVLMGLIIVGVYNYLSVNMRNQIFGPINVETKETLEETKKELNGSPFKIQLWLTKNITGKVDEAGVQFAQYPEETFQRRTGDCEDYAILSKYFLEERFKEIYLIGWEGYFKPESKMNTDKYLMHAICVFRWREDMWGIMDNNGFFVAKGSLEEVVVAAGDMRMVDIKKAYIMRFNHYSWKHLKRIINVK